MSLQPPIIATDRECLTAFRRRRDPAALRPVVERYLAFVYSSALRRTNDPARAAEVTRAVFLVLVRRARLLSKKTIMAGWLFHVTGVACRRAGVKTKRTWLRLLRRPREEFSPEAASWTRISGEIDESLERLSTKRRNAVLLATMLSWPMGSAAAILRSSETRISNWGGTGLAKMTQRLSRRGLQVDEESLALALAEEGCAVSIPDGLLHQILISIEESAGRKPSLKLARRILNTLAWARWRRRFIVGAPSLILALALLIFIGWIISARDGHSRAFTTLLILSVKNEARSVPGLAQPARPWPTNLMSAPLAVNSIRSANDLYRPTNIWLAHLKFSPEQWKALEPKRIGPLPHILQPNGTVLLRHPGAQRSGLAGVLGFDFDWTHADFEFDGRTFTNVASRIKGNGTFLTSLSGVKRSFKVDLNKFSPGQKHGGMDELNFHNLVNDFSCLNDTMACEFFRDAGVPAPRTTYAWLTVSVDGKWDRKPLGLYVMVEPVDADFAREWFGSKKAPIFKPVTYELFQDLGDEWSAYAGIYDLKTQATSAQQRRVIDFARLVSHADDTEFASRVGDFLDLEAFARFMAGQVLLSNYDSFLANGQNFYVYLDPRSNKFGFIPWDMDLSWGSFFLLGSTKQRERASIWHPWVGKNLFLERVMAVEKFRALYRARLEDFSVRLFVPKRLNQRVDVIADAIRGAVAAESDFRLRKFEDSVSVRRLAPSPTDNSTRADRSAHQIKHFIQQRSKSVRQQLDGESKGIILERSPR
jgi:DNA-directed RNA polymerase specialized sigma24 family protein